MNDLKLSIPNNQSSSSSSSSSKVINNETTNVGNGSPTSTDKCLNKSKNQQEDDINIFVEFIPSKSKSSSSSKKSIVDNSLLSDIYSKLSIIQPKKVEDIVIDESIFIPTSWQNIELKNDDDDDLSYFNMISDNANTNNFDLTNIIEIESKRCNRIKTMEKEFSSLILEYKGIINKKILSSTELYKLVSNVDTKKKNLANLQEKTRLTVQINKEKIKEYKLTIDEEKQKTIEFAEKNEKSISSISINIKDEETAIEAIKNENEGLSSKIIEYTTHINNRNSQFENQKKHIELRKQLNKARKDQIEFIRKQNNAKKVIYDENISKLQADIDKIKLDENLYKDNTEQCLEILTNTNKLEKNYNKRLSELQASEKKKEKNNSKLNNKYSDYKNEVINIDKKKIIVETMIQNTIEIGISNENIFRSVNDERKKLLQELNELGIEENEIPFLNNK